MNQDASLGEVSQSERNKFVFWEEYRYWKQQGHVHIVAMRKAIDYYRKYTSREVTCHWVAVADSVAAGQTYSNVEERLHFNSVVRSTLGALEGEQRVLFCYIIVQNDLELELNEDLLAEVLMVTGHNEPTEMKEIAACMNKSVSKKGVCTTLTHLKRHIRETMREMGFVPTTFQELGRTVGRPTKTTTSAPTS